MSHALAEAKKNERSHDLVRARFRVRVGVRVGVRVRVRVRVQLVAHADAGHVAHLVMIGSWSV